MVSWVRQGLEHQWHSFSSWEQFFISWLIHTIGVSILSVLAAFAIMRSHKFFLGTEWKDDLEKLVFYAVVTVLVGTVAVAVVANTPPLDDEDLGLLLSYFSVG
jgi:hypothetical protein